MYNDYDYDYDYFINKFNNIPDDQWTTDRFTNEAGQHCAYGHCGANRLGAGVFDTEEASALYKLDIKHDLGFVNDGKHKHYQQPTPRERVVAYLTNLKQGLV